VKRFKSIMVVHHQPKVVWATVRDHLEELVPFMDNVASITNRSRDESKTGVVRLVNHWHAKARIPSALASVIRPELLSWIDYAEWRESSSECAWRIEPRFQVDRVRCKGVARYENAMGGRGTRVTFEGTLELLAGGSLLGGTIAGALETFIVALLPHNTQSLYRAVGTFLDRRGRA